jgi:hypothetical protein
MEPSVEHMELQGNSLKMRSALDGSSMINGEHLIQELLHSSNLAQGQGM